MIKLRLVCNWRDLSVAARLYRGEVQCRAPSLPNSVVNYTAKGVRCRASSLPIVWLLHAWLNANQVTQVIIHGATWCDWLTVYNSYWSDVSVYTSGDMRCDCLCKCHEICIFTQVMNWDVTVYTSSAMKYDCLHKWCHEIWLTVQMVLWNMIDCTSGAMT